MAAGLRKCLDMGPIDKGVHPHDLTYDDEDVRYPGNWAKIDATHTRWLRVWVRWDWAEPSEGTHDEAYLGTIDQQIAQAQARGINVILVTWHFPRWSNGTVGLADTDMPIEDRRNPGGTYKPFEWKIPSSELGAGGAWANWILFLILRYGTYTNLVLEIMNEPNYQMWPQRDTGSGGWRLADPQQGR